MCQGEMQPCSELGSSAWDEGADSTDLSVQHPRHRARGGEHPGVSGPPLSSPMSLQCFSPMHIAKKWLEASPFHAAGCWQVPWAKCQSTEM